ncbi:exopolyphosphatase [Limibaculum sp. FT325]|uniref:Ppx/GppA phosphatase family protein n=1 Tax=Thermohalobaculum sediminis TaxID=2939436 RepID=UPI0020C0CDBB|nr:exopolyphosphatase [Limibaculum sediminis]MCL5778571.1 exopolyphosphatase [Limibaculum sediminis]
MTREMPRPPSLGDARALGAADMQRDFFGVGARSFARPDRLADGRIGVIDAGSNSVRLVVFEGGQRSPAVIHNEKVMCALGARLNDTGRLDPAGVGRALAALRRFAALADHLEVAALQGVATAAIRDAEDGPEFRAAVERETGIRLTVASGGDEARLSAQGVLFGNPGAAGIVVDLGGASMELCGVAEGRVGPGVTTPLGPLRLAAIAARGGDVGAEVRRTLDALDPSLRAHGHRMYLVGGSWRALARLQMDRADYPLKVLHEYTIGPDDAAGLADWAAAASPEAIAAFAGVSQSRAPVLPFAGEVLRGLLAALAPREVVVSAFGLREGVCFENMPPLLRRQDPLIAGCIDQEQRRARAPGFGAELGDWVLRALHPADAAEERLIRAAGHLADVNWRTHPDYRVQGCWETVTRVSVSDIGHRARVILGAALSYRHKRGRKTLAGVDAMRLISEAERDRAEQIGLALRLGIEIAAGTPGVLGDVEVTRDEAGLSLTLGGASAELRGEEIERRLAQFAKALGVEGRIVSA